MLISAVAVIAFLLEPSSVVERIPFKPVPRYMQVGSVPGSGPDGLPDVPFVLRVTVNPPSPRAPYTIIATYDPSIRAWSSGGYTVIRNPYHAWTETPGKRNPNGTPNPSAYGCFLNYGILRVNSASPYQAGPNLWNTPFLDGYVVSVGP